jgi:hypothetical protein
MMTADWFMLGAVICGVCAARLALKASFLADFRNQMQSHQGLRIESVHWTYRILAWFYIGPRRRWLNVFDPASKDAAR